MKVTYEVELERPDCVVEVELEENAPDFVILNAAIEKMCERTDLYRYRIISPTPASQDKE